MERFTTYDEIIAMDWEEVTQEQAEEMLGAVAWGALMLGCALAGACFVVAAGGAVYGW